LDHPRFDSQHGKDCSLLYMFRTALRPNQVSGVSGVLPPPPGYNSLGIKLTVHLHLVLRLRINGVVPLLPHVFMVFT
jgi:hypothetical protein